MTDKPTTATEAMMRLDFEGQRIEARDRAVAISVGQQMVERHFNPERVDDMRDVRQQMTRAAEHAAYEAIQQERKLHAHDMAALRAWADCKWADAMLKPVVIKANPPSPESHT